MPMQRYHGAVVPAGDWGARMQLSTGVIGTLKRGGVFLIVGGLAFVVDAALFNVLVYGVDGRGIMIDAPVLAKLIAIVVATVVTYIGNRYWTFGSRAITPKFSRYVVFALLNVIAMGLQLGALAFSRYVLGFEGILADNISGTIIGQVLATAFRYFTYDRWVFPDEAPDARRLGVRAE